MAGREILGAAFVVLAGCSSETTVVVPNCGPGTVAKDGVCVPAAEDAGGDVLADSSAIDDLGSDAGTDAPADGTDVGDAETGPVTHPDDAPCPTLKYPLTPEYELKNCSDTCGVKKSALCATSCQLPSTSVFVFGPEAQKSWLRTPSRPGAAKMCKEPCASSGIAASVQVQGDWGTSGISAVLEIKVDPPWYVAGGPLQPAASCSRASLSCYRFAPTQPVSVYTTDPDAPARNIEVTVVKGAKLGACL